MNKRHHPLNRYERIVNAEKKAQAQARRKVRDRAGFVAGVVGAKSASSAVRLAREAIKAKELEDAVSSGEDC